MTWIPIAILLCVAFVLVVFAGDHFFEWVRRRHERPPWTCPVCGEETRNVAGHRCGSGI